jgi:alginate O-acetyltransferase complex protein AlgI
LAGWTLTFSAFAIGMTLFRSPDIQTAGRMFEAMMGHGHAPVNPPILVSFDFWALEQGYFTEAFVRRWLGSYWSVVGTLVTLILLAAALALPDTMEFVNYREGEPHSDWRRPRRFLTWSPSIVWAVTILALFGVVFANLGSFSEFLYYQF